VTDVVRRVPMAWILGFGVGLKPTRQPKKKDKLGSLLGAAGAAGAAGGAFTYGGVAGRSIYGGGGATGAYTKDAKVRNDSVSHKGPASSCNEI